MGHLKRGVIGTYITERLFDGRHGSTKAEGTDRKKKEVRRNANKKARRARKGGKGRG